MIRLQILPGKLTLRNYYLSIWGVASNRNSHSYLQILRKTLFQLWVYMAVSLHVLLPKHFTADQMQKEVSGSLSSIKFNIKEISGKNIKHYNSSCYFLFVCFGKYSFLKITSINIIHYHIMTLSLNQLISTYILFSQF